VIEIGNFAFEVLHLPGHSPGSIGLFDRQQKMLISGDAIYPGKLVDDIPGADVDQYLVTMRLLRRLDVDTFTVAIISRSQVTK
jgi:glyoxylase-like metal-dependent hydrolase (beta-lactamase superfamily II)